MARPYVVAALFGASVAAFACLAISFTGCALKPQGAPSCQPPTPGHAAPGPAPASPAPGTTATSAGATADPEKTGSHGSPTGAGAPIAMSEAPLRQTTPVLPTEQLRALHEDKTMSSTQRLVILMEALHRALRAAEDLGIGDTGITDKDAELGIIVSVMGQRVDASDLRRALQKATDPAVKERLTMALGLAGDRSVLPRMVEALANDPRSSMRDAAITAIVHLAPAENLELLRSATHDPYFIVEVRDVGDPGYFRHYPIRGIATAALLHAGEDVPESLRRQKL